MGAWHGGSNLPEEDRRVLDRLLEAHIGPDLVSQVQNRRNDYQTLKFEN